MRSNYVKYEGEIMTLQEYNKQVMEEYVKGYKEDNLGFKSMSDYLLYCIRNHFLDEEVEFL